MAAIAAVLATADPAHAQLTNPTASGALVAVPYLTSSDGAGPRTTVVTVTRTGDGPVRTLYINAIRGSDWSAIDFECALPARTAFSYGAISVSFVFEAGPVPGVTKVTTRCGESPRGLVEVVRFVGGPDGILVVALEEPVAGAGDKTLQENILRADATISDPGAGTAFSIRGIHFQGVPGPLGDRLYRFDGSAGEYLESPSLLTAEFLRPDDHIRVELILFTLDGRVSGGPGIRAELEGLAFDDQDVAVSATIHFDCFAIVDLTAIPNGFGDNVLRDDPTRFQVGILELSPGVVPRDDVHDRLPPAGGNSVGARRPPVHGWVVETLFPVMDGDMPMGTAAPLPPCSPPCVLARQLGQGPMTLMPLGTDVPALDATFP